MSTQTIGTRGASQNWLKWLIVVIVLGVIAYLISPVSPFGSFWRPSANFVMPATGIQLFLFYLLTIAEVASFGLGVAFLLFGYPLVQRVLPDTSRSLAVWSYLAIAWSLINWWPHDSIILHVGLSNPAALLWSEYLFHVTMMIAGIILMAFFFAVARQRGDVNR